MSNETIHPNGLTPAHINRRAIVTLPDRTEVRGPLGPYQHEIQWVSEQRLCELDRMFHEGPSRTTFTIRDVEMDALTGDGATIAFLDEKEA